MSMSKRAEAAEPAVRGAHTGQSESLVAWGCRRRQLEQYAVLEEHLGLGILPSVHPRWHARGTTAACGLAPAKDALVIVHRS